MVKRGEGERRKRRGGKRRGVDGEERRGGEGQRRKRRGGKRRGVDGEERRGAEEEEERGEEERSGW